MSLKLLYIRDSAEDFVKAAYDLFIMDMYDYVGIPSSSFPANADDSHISIPSDTLLSSEYWARILLYCPPKITTSFYPNWKQDLLRDVSWACHLGVKGIVLTLPSEPKEVVMLAYALAKYMVHPQLSIYVKVPLDGYDLWQLFFLSCNLSNVLRMILIVDGEDSIDDLPLKRWRGEPIEGIELNHNAFESKEMDRLDIKEDIARIISPFFDFPIFVSIEGVSDISPHYYPPAIQALDDSLPPLTEQEEFEAPYVDVLQLPLQPLQDNLESGIYETFERDPIKYQLYQEAIHSYYEDHFKGNETCLLMVLGAGRGPLVQRAIQAARDVGVYDKVRIIALEKNENALITLRYRQREVWGDKVKVVGGDMRYISSLDRADVVVSELLGSFGDNELSPECLDGALHLLKEGGVMIPQRYTSFLSPLSASVLYLNAIAAEKKSPFEIPYVVRFHNAFEVTQAQPCFTFTHPNVSLSSNDREEVLSFEIPIDVTIHGFAGYFTAHLYQDVVCSITPETFSEGMMSWFPIYLPIERPLQLKKEDTLVVRIERKSGNHKVWYEWSVVSPTVGRIHNMNGKAYSIGL